MDLTIEAVTGTVYDLCVSPFETILGIKTKIQRLEGIPVSQQHLVYGSTELMDEYCLEEYGIRSGSQLKLIIAMKVGPIHAHRIQLEDSAFLEIAEYLQSQSPDDQDQCTFMLLSDDIEGRSQLQSPIEISESRLSGSQTSLVATVQPKISSVVENAITRDKMKDIRSQLQALRLNKAEPISLVNTESKLKRNPTAKLIVLDKKFPSTLSAVPTCNKSFGYKSHQYHHTNEQHLSKYSSMNSEESGYCDSRGKDSKFWKREHRSRIYGAVKSNGPVSERNSTIFLPRIETNQTSSNALSSSAVRRLNIQPTPLKSGRSGHYSNNYLPTIVMKKSDPTNNRCSKCRRKTRLTNTFTCRCGGMFCAIHRYAETHSCTFNYKAEGRENIARNNPLVTAPKLPKI